MSLIEKLSKGASNVAKFMARYADEASNIADVFRAILPAIPVNRNDKAKIESVINQLDGVADRIGDFLENNADVASPVTVKKSDVEAAIKAYLEANPNVIEAAVSAVLAKDSEGNGNV